MELSSSKKILLGIQHLFAMFGATVLVPALTGLNPSVALIAAGIGTFIFHYVTGKKVPVFLGSSFAFIGGTALIVKEMGVPSAQGAILIAGLVYAVLSLLVKLVGIEQLRSFFPPVVTGPVIVVIGLTLSPVAIGSASKNWAISLIVLASVIIVSVFVKGFFKLVPILIGIVVGFIATSVSDIAFGTAFINIVAFKGITLNPTTWINPVWKFDGTFFSLPVFNLKAILLIAPVALVTFMEHVGDITTNGSVVGKDFFKDPGLHRTLLGDGLATSFAGLIGGPANTTYSENTGVLAVTKMYNPALLRIAAAFAIVLGVIKPIGVVLQIIPEPVMGGVSILLFGMIASIGIRTLAEAKLDFTQSRNLIVVALILVIGIGMSSGVKVTDNFSLSGLFLAVIVGAVVNKILPQQIEKGDK